MTFNKAKFLTIFKHLAYSGQFSPFDLMISVRIICFLVCWKILSVDYTALASILKSPIYHNLNPDFIHRLTPYWENILFDSPLKVRIVQLLIFTLFALTGIFIKRYLIFMAMVPSLLLEWTLWKWRGDMFDADFPMAILFLMALWPGQWTWNKSPSSRVVDLQSTRIGAAILIYLGLGYFYMGVSKMVIPDWINTIHLDNLYACMHSWHQVTLPNFLDTTARFTEMLFTKYKWFGPFCGAMTLYAEFFWWTSFFRSPIRYIFPFIMFGGHIIIYLGSGLFFLSIAVVAFSFVVPWRKITTKPIKQPKAFSLIKVFTNRQMLAFTALMLLAIGITQYYQTNFHPYGVFQFGWSYKGCKTAKETLYRLGYWDKDSQSWEMVPENYFGFHDFKGILKQGNYFHLIESEKPEDQAKALGYIDLHSKLIRPYDSNRWLLGNLGWPNHLATVGKDIPLSEMAPIVLLKGNLDYENQGRKIYWQRITDYEFYPEGTKQ